MPTITAQGKTIECQNGANLRRTLLQHGINLHNGNSMIVNCQGIGTCGTCAVKIHGPVSEMQWREKTRLSLPPHQVDRDRRLACQVKVLGDLEITKYEGFWGHMPNHIWTPQG